MATLSTDTLEQLIAQGESSSIELKAGPPRPGELAQRLCGMANAQGGIIILGVNDNRKVVGVRNTHQAVDVILRAARQIEPPLVLDPPEPEIYPIDGKHIIVAFVPPNTGPLYQAGGVCWTRRGSYTVPLTVSQMLEAAHDRGLISWESQITFDAPLESIDEQQVYQHLTKRSSRGLKNSNHYGSFEEILLALGCARKNKQGEVLPTNAGILFFGRDPQRYILQGDITCVLFRNSLGVGGYTDRKIIRGTLTQLIDETEALQTSSTENSPTFQRTLRFVILSNLFPKAHSQKLAKRAVENISCHNTNSGQEY